ncbi:hypothetical protein NDU88_003695 [Pleurodeles waltl]|uniref:Uncharacterized protein n=1 Tax=Pleurodeles waltl TaxID=8319 RepID=A0AAV7SGQ0_PLEWA|nr:hypothetical protein NDU88_003695 [Pleurodeles waltl]
MPQSRARARGRVAARPIGWRVVVGPHPSLISPHSRRAVAEGASACRAPKEARSSGRGSWGGVRTSGWPVSDLTGVTEKKGGTGEVRRQTRFDVGKEQRGRGEYPESWERRLSTGCRARPRLQQALEGGQRPSQAGERDR